MSNGEELGSNRQSGYWNIKRSIFAIIFGGAVSTILLTSLTGFNLKTVEKDAIEIADSYVPEWELANELQFEMKYMGYKKLEYKLYSEEQLYEEIVNKLDQVDSTIHELENLADHHELEEVSINITKFESTYRLFEEKLHDFHEDVMLLQTVEISMEQQLMTISTILEDVMLLTGDEDHFFGEILNAEIEQSFLLWKAIAKEDIEAIIAVRDEFIGISNNLNHKLDQLTAVQNIDLALKADELSEGLKMLTSSFDDLIAVETKLKSDETTIDDCYNLTLELASTISDSAKVRTRRYSQHAASTVAFTFWTTLFLAVGAITVALIMGILIAKSINGRLRFAIEKISSSISELSESSVALSQTSQTLANASSEQAGEIQEVTASVEEITSQINLNDENTGNAKSEMHQASILVEEGVEAIAKVNKAMVEIDESAGETTKIIQTINHIAFQTNLLALNAAVEAARAGEAGKGFSVVAEEVRALAQRSAEAASETSALIKRSQENSKQGVEFSKEAERKLKFIAETTKNMGDMFSGIAASTHEQMQGIGQIRDVMTSMDQVVQDSAASSEYTASSAEELSAQAMEMKVIVEQLCTLAGVSNEESVITGFKNYEGAKPSSLMNTGAYAPSKKDVEKEEFSFSEF